MSKLIVIFTAILAVFIKIIKKIIIIFIAALAIFIFGLILPLLIFPPTRLGHELNTYYRQAVEPFGWFLVTGKIFQDKNNQYQNRCVVKNERVLMQSYTWMFIPGPVIEACINPEQGLHTVGTIKKGVIYPNF